MYFCYTFVALSSIRRSPFDPLLIPHALPLSLYLKHTRRRKEPRQATERAQERREQPMGV
jgi:hypothetical protein